MAWYLVSMVPKIKWDLQPKEDCYVIMSYNTLLKTWNSLQMGIPKNKTVSQEVGKDVPLTLHFCLAIWS